MFLNSLHQWFFHLKNIPYDFYNHRNFLGVVRHIYFCLNETIRQANHLRSHIFRNRIPLVWFAWSDPEPLIINSAQAILFLLIAWYGIRKGLYVLAAGYFLHGTWDLFDNLFQASNLIPPHYDLFCLSIDFTIGFYLLVIKYRDVKRHFII